MLDKQSKLKRRVSIIVKWSPEVYRITSIIKGGDYSKDQYTLESLVGQPLLSERAAQPGGRHGNARVFANDLKLVAKSREDIPEDAELPFDLANRLNRAERTIAVQPAPAAQPRQEVRARGGSQTKAVARPVGQVSGVGLDRG